MRPGDRWRDPQGRPLTVSVLAYYTPGHVAFTRDDEPGTELHTAHGETLEARGYKRV